MYRHRIFSYVCLLSSEVQYSTVQYNTLPGVAVTAAFFGERDQGQPRDLDCIVLYCIARSSYFSPCVVVVIVIVQGKHLGEPQEGDLRRRTELCGRIGGEEAPGGLARSGPPSRAALDTCVPYPLLELCPVT